MYDDDNKNDEDDNKNDDDDENKNDQNDTGEIPFKHDDN